PLWPFAAAAAALVVGVMVPRPHPQLVLVDGSEMVEGDVLVTAAGVSVDVDGRATISLEPRAGAGRGTNAEENDMKFVAGALAGALVTVSVYEGKAQLTTPDGKEITVLEGHTQSVDGTLAGAGPAAPVAGASHAAKGGETVAELRAQVADLQ